MIITKLMNRLNLCLVNLLSEKRFDMEVDGIDPWWTLTREVYRECIVAATVLGPFHPSKQTHNNKAAF